MSNRRKLIIPRSGNVIEQAPRELVVPQTNATCEMLIPPDDRPCGRPAHYTFELAREQWAKMPTDKPIIGHACVTHGKEAREMPGLLWIRAL